MTPYPFILILCRAKEAMSDEPNLQGARAPASPPIIFCAIGGVIGVN